MMPSDTEEAERAKPWIKYVIVRNTDLMCGEHSLRNDRKFNNVVSSMSLLMMIVATCL
jgi:hypothetical protein